MDSYLHLLNEIRTVEVTLDPALHTTIQQHNPGLTLTNPVSVPINLFKLLIAIGTIQTKSLNPTPIMKLNRVEDFVSWIKPGALFQIIKTPDADWNNDLSEGLGLGLSILVADYFFKLRWKQLGKIMRPYGSKPDIQCLTRQIKELVIEAKGTTDAYFRRTVQIAKSRNQKKNKVVQADIRVASCSLLNSTIVSNVEFFDPPNLLPGDREYTKKLLMTDHYSRIFNLIGQKELSTYFGLMRKRLIHDKAFPEYAYKERLFEKIKKDYVKVTADGREYVGNIDKISQDKYIFAGIDDRLISLQGFLDFQEVDETNFTNNENIYHVMQDGVCIGDINNLAHFKDLIDIRNIRDFREFVSIRDLDFMREPQIIDYFSYLFAKLEIQIINEQNSNFKLDQVIKYNNTTYFLEYKKNMKQKLPLVISQLSKYFVKDKKAKIVLITLDKISKETEKANRPIIFIDRAKIKLIIKDFNTLPMFLVGTNFGQD